MSKMIQETTKRAEHMAKPKATLPVAKKPAPRSLQLFETGIQTCGQLAGAMSLLMADLISDRVGTSVGNAVCNAAGKMLKSVEMQQRFGRAQGDSGRKELRLIA